MNNEIRISERNKIKTQISDIEKYIVRHKATIDRLKSQDSSEFNRNQIKNLNDKISDYDKTLIELNQRYTDIGLGKLDEDLLKQCKDTNTVIQQKREVNDKKINDKQNDKINDEIRLQKYYADNKKNRTESQYSIVKETDKFIKNNDIFPDYILKNLKDMPCNKGYIWRGIWAMGEKPSKGHDIVMFEKLKGGLLRIIEIDSQYKTIYEKVGKNPKVFISKTQRIIL